MAESAVANSPFVTEMARHIIAAGGKRFRPLLVFLSSRFGGEVDEDNLLRAAMVMELTHVASLYHDDVMDAADLRRGAPSANRLWGNSVAILVGDFLFARASTTVAELGVEYVHLQAETFSRLVQGQIAETKGAGDGEDPLAHYIQVIADKTGSLIAASARFGGMVSGAPEPTLDALSAFGEEVGLVFQLSDDLIDITSTTTGKTPGTDLREGVPTLPVLMLRAENDPTDAELLARIDSDLSSDEALAEVLAALREHPVMGRAKAEVERRAQIAREHLAPLPEGEAKDALLQVCTDLVERTN
nr:polyprenyl synthetase family protein [Tessaracoccus palaemonis]